MKIVEPPPARHPSRWDHQGPVPGGSARQAPGYHPTGVCRSWCALG